MKAKIRRINLINAVVNEATNRLVRIDWSDVDENGDFTTAKFGVNWGCVGSATTDEAVKFAKSIELACKVADELNRLEIEIDYDRDEMLATGEQHAKWYDLMYKFISVGCTTDVIELFLTK